MSQMVLCEQLIFGLCKLYFYYSFLLKIKFFFFFWSPECPFFVGFSFGTKVVFGKTSHSIICVAWSQAQGHIGEQVLNIFYHRQEEMAY